MSAASAVVMEASTGTVLYEKNPHEVHYPANITKIMTTLLALENSQMGEEVTFSHDAVFSIDRTSTHISRDVGEVMTMEQCLYGVMLGSANDCAYAVAEHVGGNYSHFIDMMNERAAELGCTDTHFNNAHGLPDEQHYTSAYDMALISRAAINNSSFRTITGTVKYTIPPTNKHSDPTYIVNHHQMLTNYQGVRDYLYPYCIGGKTGFTEAARRTLVTFAEKDGMTLICVVMKDEGNAQYTDTRTLLDYVFNNFKLWNVAENETGLSAQKTSGTWKAVGSDEMSAGSTAESESSLFSGFLEEENNLIAVSEDGGVILPKSVSFSDASCTVKLMDSSSDSSGSDADQTVLATLEYTYAGRTVGNANLIVGDVSAQSYPFHSTLKKGAGSGMIVIELRYLLAVGAGVLVVLGVILFWGLHPGGRRGKTSSGAESLRFNEKRKTSASRSHYRGENAPKKIRRHKSSRR